ncbi:MAG: hypothetical protein K0U66_04255 [Gammaproteobacteria bacterium]|nr:hypothetical protein [Gammaproteobacteria bacterium]
MPHDNTTAIQYFYDPITRRRTAEVTQNGNLDNVLVLSNDSFKHLTLDEDTHSTHEGGASYQYITFSGVQTAVRVSHAQKDQLLGYFLGQAVTVDANGNFVMPEGDGADDATPELQLVQDPVIYNRPETGLSQRNVPFFKFHNPNGKSAITISMTDVDHTRFDSNSDDTHHYVVVTKARIEIRCLCTVNEQLGLEFRFRGTTHVISAEESNNVRRITESRANPE